MLFLCLHLRSFHEEIQAFYEKNCNYFLAEILGLVVDLVGKTVLSKHNRDESTTQRLLQK